MSLFKWPKSAGEESNVSTKAKEQPRAYCHNIYTVVQGYPKAPFGDVAWVNQYAGNIMVL